MGSHGVGGTVRLLPSSWVKRVAKGGRCIQRRYRELRSLVRAARVIEGCSTATGLYHPCSHEADGQKSSLRGSLRLAEARATHV